MPLPTEEFIRKYVLHYIDGYAVALATYLLSPPAEKIRNTIIIGGLHMVLHDTACSYDNDDCKCQCDDKPAAQF